MPMSPKRLGSQNKQNQKPYGWRDNRGTNKQRGYGWDWQQLSAAFKKEHPLCEECLQKDIATASSHTDHIVPFNGINDPRRLDWGNLMALCERCHMSKTARASNR